MDKKIEELLKAKMSEKSFKKLIDLNNSKLEEFIGEFIELGNPEKVYFCDDSEEDAEYIKQKALEKGEEIKLKAKAHTIHFDGINDLGRDTKSTRFLVPKGTDLGPMINSMDRAEGLAEIKEYLKNAMLGKEAIIKIFCEGPVNSVFSIPCVQITDSYYVVHSEDMLYRRGYEHFKKLKNKDEFFKFCHSYGRLDENNCSKDTDKRRIYMDLVDNLVLSSNNQYAGNSVGLKKHSMRLAINKSGKEGWLCEHMFVMSVENEDKKRQSYFCGAFPSACGKTSTAMLPGEKIIGDDIAYFRNINGEFRAVNVERGIFGIIENVNPDDDPLIFKTLRDENKEIIFSNVLMGEDEVTYWLGMGCETPKKGKNFSGDWIEGKKDDQGNAIPIAHKNARYTIRLNYLDNLDKNYDDPNGVLIDAIIYGGRDSNTSVPIEEAFDWNHGVISKGCMLESETTAATIGKEGVLTFNLMSNIDFVSYPIGKYIQNNLDFVKSIKKVPKVYNVNYFLRNKEGKFCNGKLDKRIWLHWAEERCHNEVEGYKTPTGIIPKYEDLKRLFKRYLNYDYSLADYNDQFQCRVNEQIAKIDRVVEIYKTKVPDCPKMLFDLLLKQKERLVQAKAKYGDYIEPGKYSD